MVSIIIPCYNYSRFLRPAVESALGQTSADLPLEVVVVDDGSTDDTAAVAAEFGERVHYIYQNNAGLSAARNTGMREARHDLVMFLDADDMLAPGIIQKMLAARGTLEVPPAVLAGTDLPIDAAGQPKKSWPQETGELRRVTARQLVLRNRFVCTVLADRRALLALGGFDETLKASEDRDMWIRVAARETVCLLDRCVLLRRMHGTNMSLAARRQTACIQQVLAKAFANPQLDLSRRDQRLAQAVCLYQSALMYSAAHDHGAAMGQLLLSMVIYPFGSLAEANIRRWGRLISLAAIGRSAVRSIWRGN